MPASGRTTGGRWDLLDAMRWCLCVAVPTGLNTHARGRAPQLQAGASDQSANGLMHERTRTTPWPTCAPRWTWAPQPKTAQPKLWIFFASARRRKPSGAEIGVGRPFLHVSACTGGAGGSALVWLLAPHPTNKNELIVWDCAADPAELAGSQGGRHPPAHVHAAGGPARRRDATGAQDHPRQQVAHRPGQVAEPGSHRALGPGPHTGPAPRRAAGTKGGCWTGCGARSSSASRCRRWTSTKTSTVASSATTTRRALQRVRALSPQELADRAAQGKLALPGRASGRNRVPLPGASGAICPRSRRAP